MKWIHIAKNYYFAFLLMLFVVVAVVGYCVATSAHKHTRINNENAEYGMYI